MKTHVAPAIGKLERVPAPYERSFGNEVIHGEESVPYEQIPRNFEIARFDEQIEVAVGTHREVVVSDHPDCGPLEDNDGNAGSIELLEKLNENQGSADYPCPRLRFAEGCIHERGVRISKRREFGRG